MIHQNLARAFRKSSRRRTPSSTRRLLFPESLEARRVLAVITGSVVNDLNDNGEIEVGEPGMAGLEVYVDANQNNMLDISGTVVEPDHFEADTLIEVPGVSLSLQTATGVEGDVIIAIGETPGTGEFASTGNLVFGIGENDFFNEFSKLRMDFDAAVSSVTIDVIGSSRFAEDVGVLEVYDSNDALLASVSSSGLCISEACSTQIETIRVDRPEGDIAYALAFTKLERLTARFDALRINDGDSEHWTLTNNEGSYALRGLASGNYRINQVTPEGYRQTAPTGGSHEVVITDADVPNVDFANHEEAVLPAWQNPDNPLDVNDDGFVSPIDALRIINEINNPSFHDAATGKLQDPPPAPIPAYFDVDGNDFISPVDALRIINHINSETEAAMNGEAEDGNATSAFATPVFIESTNNANDLANKRSQHTAQATGNDSLRPRNANVTAVSMLEIDQIFQEDAEPGSETTGSSEAIDDSIVLQLAKHLVNGTI